MTEPDADRAAPDAAQSAGAMLRAAREKQGMHIAVLAASIKVSPRKLDALERDRYEELPDATFVRALAQTVCRALKIDAAPVLARLPQIGGGLQQVSGGLNAPFRDRPGRADPVGMLPQRPLVWAGIALLVAAAVLLFVPSRFWGGDPAESPAAGAVSTPVTPDPAASTPTAAVPAPAVDAAASAVPPAPAALAASAAPVAQVETVHSAPPSAVDSAVATKGASITTSDASWIEAVDGNGQMLLSRVVQPGETVALTGPTPLKLKIGNAKVTQLVFRGQPVDLAASTRDNVARVELK